MHVLELHVDDRLRSRQTHSSRIMRSMFGNKTNATGQYDRHVPRPSMPAEPATCPDNSSSVDEAIDTEAYAQLGSRLQPDLVVHVLAILRCVPLVMLYQSTGWQTHKLGMARSQTHLGQFIYQNSIAARKCLWHAAIIFTELRNVRHFACYDALNLCVAVCYIWSYTHLSPEARHQEQPSRGRNPTRPQCPIVRVDKLVRKLDVEEWIRSREVTETHITGVGSLKGSNSCLILLNDAMKTLMNQRAWSGLCRALARSFAQLRNGGTPDMDSD